MTREDLSFSREDTFKDENLSTNRIRSGCKEKPVKNPLLMRQIFGLENLIKKPENYQRNFKDENLSTNRIRSGNKEKPVQPTGGLLNPLLMRQIFGSEKMKFVQEKKSRQI